MTMLFPKGSEWRKWDLHVHTPYSVEQHYGDGNDPEVWEAYISDLEKLSPDFKVLGINDYLFIDGYERLLKEKNENGRLKNIDLLLPVVEFRISKFSGVDFGGLKRINLHVIFSNEISPDVIKSQFLNGLQQSYKLEPGAEGSAWSGVITKESLGALGASIKASVPKDQLQHYDADLIEGFRNLNLDEKSIINQLEENSFLKGKYLLAIGKTEWDSLKWSDSSISSKKDIINKSDIVFVASESIERFNTAKEKLKSQSVNHLLLDCSDAHYYSDSQEKDRIGNCNTWIKSDPTFEGLKQIVHEPERVQIHSNQPDDKAGYQVIDRIEINDDLILNTSIDLNVNMNSIVGGRSTGKSVLLTAIAQKLKTERPIEFPHHKLEYREFVKKVSNSISVYWKDGEQNNDREIEFFQQGYMYDLATSELKLSKLVKNILKNKGKGDLLEGYSAKKTELKKSISTYITDLFQVISDIRLRSSELSDKGDLKGVQDEINRLQDKMEELDSLSLSEQERHDYEQNKKIIERATNTCSLLEKDLTGIQRLREVSLVKQDIEYEFSTISEISRIRVNNLYSKLKKDIDAKWAAGLDESMSEVNLIIDSENQKIAAAQQDHNYIKASQAYANSAQLNEIHDRIKEQKTKLSEIESVTVVVRALRDQKDQLIKKILSDHKSYFDSTVKLLSKLSSSQDELKIEAKCSFKSKRYRETLEGSLNLQGAANRNIVDYQYENDGKFIEHQAKILNSLINNSLSLKGGYTNQSLASALLTECFYDISYDLIYENDNFKTMSDGKKAFVVLKLLLDFSDKKCPILIDQPEDDLDNRAIYLDLVKYFKKKKIQRQVILATHNPNIVVSADSELVIVANQHGIKNENNEGKKFAYKTGSLEHSSPKEQDNIVVLDAQGIREHVCDVLEGGGDAFKLREQKYAIKHGA